MVVEQPDVKVGDTFRYRRYKREDNGPEDVADRCYEIVHVSGEQIIVRGTSESHPDEPAWTITYTRDWNIIRSAQWANTPYFPALSFPLEIGKKWRQSSTKVRIQSDELWKCETEGTVTGEERVTVPAGTFVALRVDVRTPFEVQMRRGRELGRFEETFWYAREVRDHVKYTFEDWTASGSLLRKGRRELVSFKHK